jgi:hypothetical protein
MASNSLQNHGPSSYPTLRKRDSKKLSKAEAEALQRNRLLQIYNDRRTLEESKEIPFKHVILRRISKRLVEKRADLYRFPILEYVTDTSKILMLEEIELIYWYHLMKTYLSKLNGEARFSEESVQLFFFQAGIFVKKFLLQI